MGAYGVAMAILIYIGGTTVLDLRETPSCGIGSNCWWEVVDVMWMGVFLVVLIGIPLCFLSWFTFIKRGWRKSGCLAFAVFAVVLVEHVLLSLNEVAEAIVRWR
jgi:hypothetical protein